MKFLLALFAFLVFGTLSILFSSPAEAAVTCSATSNKTQVAPGETFDITVNFSDGQRHTFDYQYVGTNRVSAAPIRPTTNPYTFTLTAPDEYFSDVKISSPTRTRPTTSCFAGISSSRPPPSNFCTFDFGPKSVEADTAISVTVGNTLVGFRYTAIVGGNRSQTLQHTGNPLVLTVNAPSQKGSYTVGVNAQGARGRQDCVATSGSTLTVTSSVSQGENPCQPGPDGTPICPTALGDIPANPIKFAERFLQIAIGIGGGIAFILMVLGAIRVLTSSGDQQKLSGGRDMIVAAIAGILFIIFSVMILRFIGIEILKI